MRLTSAAIVGTILLTVFPTARALGHHSPAGFNQEIQVTLQGTVSRFDWVNPHVYIYIDTTTGAGETAEWLIETDPVPILSRNGWSKEILAVGDLVTVRASPDRNAERNHGLLVSMAMESGLVLTPRADGVEFAARASSLAGVWDGMRGFSRRRVSDFVPTEKGLAAIGVYTEADSPAVECVPHTSPFLPVLPYLNAIEILEDTVIIRSEFYNVDRTVYR